MASNKNEKRNTKLQNIEMNLVQSQLQLMRKYHGTKS